MLVIGAIGVKALLSKLARMDHDAAERLKAAGWREYEAEPQGRWVHPDGRVVVGTFAADDMRREEESNDK